MEPEKISFFTFFLTMELSSQGRKLEFSDAGSYFLYQTKL